MHFIKQFEKLYLCLHSRTSSCLKGSAGLHLSQGSVSQDLFFSSSNGSLGWGPMTHFCLLNRMAAWTLQAGPGSLARGSPWAEGHICWQEGRIRGLLTDVLNEISDLVFQMCSCSSSYQNWSFSLFSFVIRMWQTSHSRVLFCCCFSFLVSDHIVNFTYTCCAACVMFKIFITTALHIFMWVLG